jgi:hypothetical protein
VRLWAQGFTLISFQMAAANTEDDVPAHSEALANFGGCKALGAQLAHRLDEHRGVTFQSRLII